MSRTGPEAIEGKEQNLPSSLEQTETLLRTKLFTPLIQSNRVPRLRLFEQIQSGIDRALILITAPAGYGKTTLVASWLRETEISSTWISLDEDDNDPIRFLQYFISALHSIVPAIQLDLLGVLQGRQPAQYIDLLKINILINKISEHAVPFVLVLDDFHTLHSKLILDMFAHLFEHIPPQMHVILLSRSDPPIPLSRLRVRNQLIDIRADQLRFTHAEIAKFLNGTMGLKLTSGDIDALETRTEGWIAGLQLAAISMQGGKDVHGFVSAFTGSHYYVMDYLAEEVLRLQPETVRTFLLQTSILNRMCGPLCDVVVEGDQKGLANGQAMLAALEQMNLFIIQLDSERRWYRYHHLFADVLNRQLEQLYPHLHPELHGRASRWYEQNGFIFDAIHHSLAAGDLERAAKLLDQHGCLLLMRGEVINLLHWIEAVEPYSQTLPWIAIQKAWALCLTGQLDRANGPLLTAAQLISGLELTDDVRTMLGALTAAQAYRVNILGETRLAANLARQALDCLPVSSDLSCSLRSAATSILGDASWMEGDLTEAEQAYSDAVLISQSVGNIHMVIMANTNLADILMEQGKLHQASRIYSETLQMAKLPDGQISPLAERAYAGLGRVAYEWNHMEDAEKYTQQCIEHACAWGSFESQAIGYVMSAGLEHSRRNPEKKREAMHVAEQLIRENSFTPWRSTSLECALARLWIAEGDFERPGYLLQKYGIPVDGVPEEFDIPYLQQPLYLILLRLLLAQRDHDAALALSARLLQYSDESKQPGRVIEILVLRALAFQGKKDIDQALLVLKRAFSLAQAEGYIRSFLDEGEPMAKILYQAKSRLIGSGYAAELLSVFGDDSSMNLPRAELLIEPLTLREREVLQLIEAGYSNQDIAAKLVISIPTVKRHISNIYTKLGASSRTQAVSRGKELKLFD